MAQVIPNEKLDISITLVLDEQEARAFYALVGYGTDEFLRVFYDKLGKAYMEKHENGLRSLFKAVRAGMPSPLAKLDNARKEFK